MTELKLHDYSIFIGESDDKIYHIISSCQYSKIAILVDENTRQHCLPIALRTLDREHVIIEVPSGERHKNLQTCRHIWEEMMLHRLDRYSLLINLGGGVIGDMGGFCASTFMRGIDFIQIPTTLLSQVDASVGGKLGIDFNLAKNSIGLFNNPKAVFINPTYLKTLPKNETRSGFAEVLKHALIADIDHWSDLEKIDDLSSVDWTSHLSHSVCIKQKIVEQDPFEKGYRKALNFGHTIGHAIESFTLETEKPLLHGEAIAIGLICESWLSNKVGELSKESFQRIINFINKSYIHYVLQEEHFDHIMAFMKKDKKNRKGRINFTFIPKIGKATINQYCEQKIIIDSLKFYSSLNS